MRISGTTATASVLGALTVSNLATHRWLPRHAYVPWNLALGGWLIWLARAGGHSLADIGLQRKGLARGTRMGASGAAGVAAVYLLLLSSGRTRPLLSDRRITGLSPRQVLWRSLVQIPLGTALVEEVAFRGVLPLVMKGANASPQSAHLLSSALFGFWHLLPAHEEASANGAPVAAHLGGTVVATSLAGALLHQVRHRAGHIAAPVALHTAANVFGVMAARLAARH